MISICDLDLDLHPSPGAAAAATIVDRLKSSRDEMTNLLGELVRIESPSDDPAGLAQMAARLEELFGELGAVSRHSTGGPADHLSVTIEGAESARLPPAVVLCHYDTVWRRGTLDHMPFAVDDRGIATGPGCFDMKGGIVLLFYALRELQAIGLPPRRTVRILLTCDEEVGSRTSRDLITATATDAGVALVLEAPLPGGTLKTARKGTGIYQLQIHGKAAHSGIEPERGVSAILELAHQVIALNALNEYNRGIVVNVGVVRGGSRLNVIPAYAEAEISYRAVTVADADRLHHVITSLESVVPGTEVSVTPGPARPPMERTPATGRLFARARAIATATGVMDLAEGSTGGGSDGNLVAALGLPTLDGLGPEGGGAHADDEHVFVESMPRRAALLAGLLAEA